VELVEEEGAEHREGAVREVQDAGASIDEQHPLREEHVDGSAAEAERGELDERAHRLTVVTGVLRASLDEDHFLKSDFGAATIPPFLLITSRKTAWLLRCGSFAGPGADGVHLKKPETSMFFAWLSALRML
jgi:hypothetical protein